jgi:hypothetical protein
MRSDKEELQYVLNNLQKKNSSKTVENVSIKFQKLKDKKELYLNTIKYIKIIYENEIILIDSLVPDYELILDDLNNRLCVVDNDIKNYENLLNKLKEEEININILKKIIEKLD